MSREVMKQALEALEKVIEAFGPGLTLQQRAITALRQALETEKQWVGLTDEQRREIAFRWREGNGTASEIIDMVEVKLKEKNT